MPTKHLIVRHTGLVPVDATAVLVALSPAESAMPREDVEVDTRRFAAQLEQGDWGGQDAFLAEKASEIHGRLETLGDAALHYFGIAEIPHAIALGAKIGDEIPVLIHEYDRDANSWKWPQEQRTVTAQMVNAPSGSVVPASGSAVLRVAVSAAISNEDVQQAAGTDHLVDVTVTLAGEFTPGICRVKSSADLMEVRLSMREALGVIRGRFPNLETLHVFVAAPMSVSFALGQELKPRNSPPIQTYRYRKIAGRPAYAPAIELTAQGEARADDPLSAEDLDLASAVRWLWVAALPDIESYALAKRSQASGRKVKWYEVLSSIPELVAFEPYVALPPLSDLVPQGATIDPAPRSEEYEFSTAAKVWRLSDRLLVGFHKSTQQSLEATKHLIEIFLIHEYLHDYHGLTAVRATGIGAFPNCLEHADFAADAYALLHHLDMHAANLTSEEARLAFLREQVGRVVRSFWAFEPPAPVREWQVRRLRRYLNWYWRLTQLQYAPSLAVAVRLLDHAPHVEIAGLHQFARNQRVLCRIDRRDSQTRPEVALILENERILRIADSPTSNIDQLLVALQNGDHDAIARFFEGAYERAREVAGALPSV